MISVFVLALAMASAAQAFEAPKSATCSAIKRRVDCGNLNVTQATCEARGCCFEPVEGQPHCFFASEGAVISRVHLIESNHFDAGFTNYTKDVLSDYFFSFVPRAINVSSELHAKGGEAQYTWLTQSYIMSLFLDCPPGFRFRCPNATERSGLEAALKAGTIYYHAYPHNGQNEIADASHLRFGVNMTHELDDRLGIPRKIALSQRDVPGLARAELSPLAAEGVQFISEGSNAANIPPDVPPVFWWSDESSGTRMLVAFHPFGYGTLSDASQKPPPGSLPAPVRSAGQGSGGYSYPPVQESWSKDYVRIPGFSEVMVYNWRVDNHGPVDNATEVEDTFALLHTLFPGAEVGVSTVDTFAQRALAFLSQPGNDDNIPTLTAEIGDSWLYGAAADPVKLMQFRSAARLRSACIEAGKCDVVNDASFRNFSRILQKASEHTFGQSGSVMGKAKWHNISNSEFHALIRNGSEPLAAIEYSWEEQRNYSIGYAVEALPPGSPLRDAIEQDFGSQRRAAQTPTPAAEGFERVADPTAALPHLAGWLTLRFGANSSAAEQMRDETTGNEWASAQHPVGVYQYQTLDEASFRSFQRGYCSKAGQLCFEEPVWSSDPKPLQHLATPALQEVWVKKLENDTASVLVHGSFGVTELGRRLQEQYGAPAEVWVRYDIGPVADRDVDVTVTLVNKTATRMPEAGYVGFAFAGNVTDGSSSAWQLRQAPHPVWSIDEARDIARRSKEALLRDDPSLPCQKAAARLAGSDSHEAAPEAEPSHPVRAARRHAPRQLHGAHHGGSSLTALLKAAHHVASHTSGLEPDDETAWWGGAINVSESLARGIALEAHHFPRDDVMATLWRSCGSYVDRVRAAGPEAHAALVRWLDGTATGQGHHGRALHKVGRHEGHEEHDHGSEPNHSHESESHEHGRGVPELAAALLSTHEDHDCAPLAPHVLVEPIQVDDVALYRGWELNKLGEWMDPSDYVGHAAHSLDGVGEGVRFTPASSVSSGARVTVDTTDAGIVRWGAPFPFPTPMTGPVDFSHGATVLLHTQVYPVNFPLWLPWASSAEAHADGIHAGYGWRFRIAFD